MRDVPFFAGDPDAGREHPEREAVRRGDDRGGAVAGGCVVSFWDRGVVADRSEHGLRDKAGSVRQCVKTSVSAAGVAAARGVYLYGIVRSSAEVAGIAAGLCDAPTRLIVEGDVAGLVSDAPAGRLRPERRHLSAHQRVLTSAWSLCDVLPMAFGTAPGSESAVRGLLRGSAVSLLEELDRIRGRCEMTLRVSITGGNAFAHLVESDAGLRSARDAMLASGGAHELKVEVGRRFGAALEGRRSEALSAVLSEIEARCDEVKVNPARSESELVNLSMLVERGGVACLEESIGAAAGRFDDRHTFDISGPWPPHSFVDLRLEPA